MGIKTSSNVSSGGSGSGYTYQKNVYFGFEDADRTSAVITVSGAPVHIIAPNLPEDCVISVERLYSPIDGECDLDIPPAPVYCPDECNECHNGCSPLALFNAEDDTCTAGYKVQNDIWLTETGHYRLVMNSCCDPEEVYVYGIEDPLIRDMGCCPVNSCLPGGYMSCENVYRQGIFGGGGAGMDISNMNGSPLFIVQGRDGAILDGSGVVTMGQPLGKDYHWAELTITNPFNCPSLLWCNMKANAVGSMHGEVQNVKETFAYMLSETLAESYPQVFPANPYDAHLTAVGTLPAERNMSAPGATSNLDLTLRGMSRTDVTFNKVLQPGESATLYAQWWMSIDMTNAGGSFNGTYHSGMFLDAIIMRGVIGNLT